MDEKKLKINSLVEDVIGCKWSLSILDMMDKGIKRPGAMVREQEGLTTKVLNERLRRFIKYKIINKIEYPEIPPRVEYEYTPLGRKFLNIVVAIRQLDDELKEKD